MVEMVAGGAKLPLPDLVVKRLYAGEELADIMASLTGQADVRKKERGHGHLHSWLGNEEGTFFSFSKTSIRSIRCFKRRCATLESFFD